MRDSVGQNHILEEHMHTFKGRIVNSLCMLNLVYSAEDSSSKLRWPRKSFRTISVLILNITIDINMIIKSSSKREMSRRSAGPIKGCRVSNFIIYLNCLCLI